MQAKLLKITLQSPFEFDKADAALSKIAQGIQELQVILRKQRLLGHKRDPAHKRFKKSV